jgi:hypothetical protein
MTYDIQFWKDLCPNLTITEIDRWVTPPKVDAEDLSERILKDGYFHIQFDSWQLPLDEMSKCIEKLKELDMHPVWCFMYDEFWLLTTKIHEHIKSILGENYSKLPAIWAWHIDPAKEERGWKIHREGYPNSVFDDGTPKTVTIWIPLSDATYENGCICVVPIPNDYNFGNTDESFYAYQSEDFYDNSKIMLEAKAGDVLGWHPQILHWGKTSTNKNATPRISISVEFISDRAMQLDDSAFLYSMDENPWIDPFHIPNQVKKTELINMLISQYKHMWETKDD